MVEPSIERSSVNKIENCWSRYRDKKMFKLLKHAIKSADHSVTCDIIRKINPNEAELLTDPVFKTRIRFRFAGEEFPPIILFKVYIQTNGRGVKYLCGKKIIKPASAAAEDSLTMMGNRKFLDQMLSDACNEQQQKVKDELEISNMKDYMKYISGVDETRPEDGGKANTWRNLTLEVVPRHHIISDVLLYLQHGEKTHNFLKNFQPHGSTSLIVPLTQSQQVKYLNVLNRRKHVMSPTETSRRSKQAKERVEKMKKLYKQQRHEEELPEENIAEISTEMFSNEGNDVCPLLRNLEINFEDDDWEDEGQMLFEWTQNLSMTNLSYQGSSCL